MRMKTKWRVVNEALPPNQKWTHPAAASSRLAFLSLLTMRAFNMPLV